LLDARRIAPARAQLSIEITGAGANRVPVAVAPFAGEAALGEGLTAVVRADLERSGLFRLLEVPPMSPAPTEASAVSYPEWRSRLADALVLGSVSARADGVRGALSPVRRGEAADARRHRLSLSREQARATAHRIADSSTRS